MNAVNTEKARAERDETRKRRARADGKEVLEGYHFGAANRVTRMATTPSRMMLVRTYQ